MIVTLPTQAAKRRRATTTTTAAVAVAPTPTTTTTATATATATATTTTTTTTTIPVLLLLIPSDRWHIGPRCSSYTSPFRGRGDQVNGHREPDRLEPPTGLGLEGARPAHSDHCGRHAAPWPDSSRAWRRAELAVACPGSSSSRE